MTKFKRLIRNIFKTKKRELLLFTALLGLFFVFFSPVKAEAALNNSYVIPDATFADSGTMSEAQIQAFLASRGSYLTNYTVPAERDVVWNGVSYHESPWIGPIGGEVNSTGWSAAHVIYQVTQWYGINPQVLLVTLQKESSLVTNSNPPYYGLVQWAMGYAYTEGGILNACNTATNHNPTGSCAGFAMQMDWAGGGLKSWMNWANSHSPNAAQYWTGNTLTIDGQAIYLSNGATAALYRYTPHIQTSFHNIFNLWFSPYNYSLTSQVLPDTYMGVGATKQLQIVLKNTGTTPWYNETYGGAYPARLQVINEDGKNFYTPGNNWLSPTRIKMTTPSVAPGQYGTFTFTMKAPPPVGYHEIRLLPIVENMQQMPNNNLYMSMTTNTGYDYSFVSQILPNSYMAAGTTKEVQVVLKNTGTATWYNDANSISSPVRLQVTNADGQGFYTAGNNWLSPTRIKMTTASVAPGANGTFTFTMKAPPPAGYHSIRFLPIVENLLQMPNKNLYMSMTTNGNYNYDFVSQILPDSYMAAGTTKQLQIVLKNTSTTTWYNDSQSSSYPTRLQVTNADGQGFYVNDGNWLSPTRIKMTTASVAPGANGTFTFTMKAPPPAGYHSIRFLPIVENLLQMPNKNLYMSMTTN